MADTTSNKSVADLLICVQNLTDIVKTLHKEHEATKVALRSLSVEVVALTVKVDSKKD
jgi:hypothetical protein